MNTRDAVRLARTLKQRMDAHINSIGAGIDAAEYERLQADATAARQLGVYLIQQLQHRHAATLLARSLGLPGYINTRR